MGFWDELEDVLTNPLDHPFEAAMFMAMTEEEKEESEGWRLNVEDGFEYGLDPEDFDTLEEYEEALKEAKKEWDFD